MIATTVNYDDDDDDDDDNDQATIQTYTKSSVGRTC